MAGEFITVARVVKPQGRHGEVAAELLTHAPERFAERRNLWALDASGHRRQLELEDFWTHKGRIVFKFAGVDSIAQAEELVGAEIQIAAEERVPLAPGEAYVSDLVGCTVLATCGAEPEREIGRIEEVQFVAGDAPLLLVRGKTDREILIPFAAEYVKELDVVDKKLRMALPQGMLD